MDGYCGKQPDPDGTGKAGRLQRSSLSRCMRGRLREDDPGHSLFLRGCDAVIDDTDIAMTMEVDGVLSKVRPW